MTTLTRLITVAMLVRLGSAAEVPAATVNSVEMRELHRWMTAKFDGDRQPALPQWGLAVLTNFDELCLNTRMGRPLAIGKREYPRGIFCHAASKVAVRLPGPGKAFSAFVGVDSNSQTRGGRGSIVFSVTVAGRQPLPDWRPTKSGTGCWRASNTFWWTNTRTLTSRNTT